MGSCNNIKYGGPVKKTPNILGWKETPVLPQGWPARLISYWLVEAETRFSHLYTWTWTRTSTGTCNRNLNMHLYIHFHLHCYWTVLYCTWFFFMSIRVMVIQGVPLKSPPLTPLKFVKYKFPRKLTPIFSKCQRLHRDLGIYGGGGGLN